MPNPQETVDRLGLKVRSEFVPFSRSRNASEKSPSLNWRVTLVRVHTPDNEAGRDILTTDYSAGMGHCPSYNRAAPSNYPNHVSRWQKEACAWECEHGRPATYLNAFGGFTSKPKGGNILPKDLDVIASLIMDSSVLDESSFEDWASSLGYDPDSRKAETIYRACLDLALKLRNGLGETALAELREAFQDY